MKNAVALQTMTIQLAYQQLLSKLYEVYENREASNIANWVIEHVTGQNKINRIVYKDIPVSAAQAEQLEKITTELLAHKPVQYVLGEAWFANLRFYVNESVLIPRPETEELVDWVGTEIESLQSKNERPVSILDVGTGSGCIPISLKNKYPLAEVSAIDVSSEALKVAKKNAESLHSQVSFLKLDFLQKHKWNYLEKYDLIVSNPPYIRQSEESHMLKNVLLYEPHVALFVPDDRALVFYEAIARFGNDHLKKDGAIFVEINESLGTATREMFLKHGYQNIELRKDMQGKDRMMRVSVND